MQDLAQKNFVEVKQKVIDMIRRRESNLPALSVVVDHIIAALVSEKTTTESLAEIINHDPSMTAKLLELSNSVYYAQRNKVTSVKRAISVIGFDEIIGIAMGMGILSNFQGKDGLSLDMKALWIHSIGTATMAKALAMKINPGIASKIFIPALLHDLGKIVYSVYFPEEYAQVRQLAIEERMPLYLAETQMFDLDHAMLSALLMKRWRFPLDIISPVRFHHSPDAAPVALRYSCLILNLANYLTQKAGIGHGGNPVPVVVKNIPRKIGISQDAIKASMEQLKKKEPQIMEFFQITTSS